MTVVQNTQNSDEFLDAVVIVDSKGTPVTFSGSGGGSANMMPASYDSIHFTYSGGNLSTKVYKLNGVTVGTVTYGYGVDGLSSITYVGV